MNVHLGWDQPADFTPGSHYVVRWFIGDEQEGAEISASTEITIPLDDPGEVRFEVCAVTGGIESAPCALWYGVQVHIEIVNARPVVSWYGRAGLNYSLERSTDGNKTWAEMGEHAGAGAPIIVVDFNAGDWANFRVWSLGPVPT